MAAALTSVKKLIACVRRSGANIIITVLPNAFKNVFQHQYGAKLENMQGGRSCAGAQVAPAEKFGLGRKF